MKHLATCSKGAVEPVAPLALLLRSGTEVPGLTKDAAAEEAVVAESSPSEVAATGFLAAADRTGP